MSEHFNHVANEWDSPEKIKLISTLGKKAKEKLNLNDKISIMDFGCGTGLFGLEFADYANELLGLDTSEGMLAVFDDKTKEWPHIKSLNINLEHEELDQKFDLILSAMAFHHLDDPKKVLNRLIEKLSDRGQMAIVDLAPEDGSFHPDPEGMGVKHFGFSSETVASWLPAGFRVDYHVINAIEKNDQAYEQFLAVISRS